MLGHKNEQKYCCNTCDKSFNTTTLLNAHKKTHNPKKHTCDSCNKSFVRNINLKIHNTTKSHIDKISGYKKYKCTICIQGFNSYNKLGDHYIKEHKLSKPFQCTLCNKKYVFKGNMVKHYNKAHENQTETQKIKNDKRDISLPKLKKLKTHQQQDKGKIPDESLLTTSNLTVADNGNQSIYQDNNKYNSPKLSDNNMPNIELKTDNDIRFGTKQVVNGENYFSNLEEYFDEKDDLFDLEKYFDEQDDI
jgi:DNA-directed RNA polymerase subunit RPC12/RpoP